MQNISNIIFFKSHKKLIREITNKTTQNYRKINKV